MNKPLISVIIPTYKRPNKLDEAIKSVMRQTYKKLEIIVIDDNNTNTIHRKKTERVVDKYNELNNFIYLKQSQNKGACAARNLGIIKANGEYIAFLDDDDVWEDYKIENQIKQMKKLSQDYGVVYSSFIRYKNQKKQIIPKNFKKNKSGYIFNELLEGNFITTQVVLIKKNCFKKVGMFDENLPRLQDWELWLRVSKIYKFKFIQEPLVKVFYSKDSISSNNDNLIKAQKYILKKHYKDFKNAGDFILSKQYASIGHNSCLNGQLKIGRSYFRKALKIKLEVRYLLIYILSFFGNHIYKFIFKMQQLMKDYF